MRREAHRSRLNRVRLGVEALGCVATGINGDGQVDGAGLGLLFGDSGACSAPWPRCDPALQDIRGIDAWNRPGPQ